MNNMKTTKILMLFSAAALISSCGFGDKTADAYGNFEVDEITVSAKVPGEIMELDITEGNRLVQGQAVGWIDTADLHLQRLEIEANIGLIKSQYASITAQIEVLQSNKRIIITEIERTKKLLASNAATTKQMDDLEGKLQVVNKQIASIETQHPSVVGQLNVARAKLDQINEKSNKSIIRNPINGIVLDKIARQHELAGAGMPIYTIADLSVMEFRAYIAGNQLSSIALGDAVVVKVDGENDELIAFEGTVKWISDEAEFTPKIIQTKEERVDMVYALKVDVINNGVLKMGMPGELYFSVTIDADSK
jgi:HlyD family secretion protein